MATTDDVFNSELRDGNNLLKSVSRLGKNNPKDDVIRYFLLYCFCTMYAALFFFFCILCSDCHIFQKIVLTTWRMLYTAHSYNWCQYSPVT